MGKKQRAAKASDHISFESDNEDLRDDVDKFHDDARKVKDGSYRKKKKAEAEEVLNVEGDVDSEEAGDSGDESSDFDDADDDVDEGISANKWGRKRKDHYNTDYVDDDWGGMREEEIEAAELEEEDALNRQKALDRAAAQSVEDFDDVTATPLQKKVETEAKLEWNLPNVKKLNKDTVKLVEEYTRRKDLMTVIVEPLQNVAQALPSDSVLCRQLSMVIDTYSKYLMDILFVLRMKSNSLGKKTIQDEILDAHPAQDELRRSKLMIEKMDSFLEKNSIVLNKLITKVSEGEDISGIPMPKVESTKKVAKNVVATADEAEEDEGEEEDQFDENGKRLAPSSIAKNSKTSKSKKKKDKHAKVANRRKFKEISKKVRSQVGKVRQETEKYSGEARGIRISTIKSTKLIA